MANHPTLTRRSLLAGATAAALIPAAADAGSAWDFAFPSIDGGTLRLADWQGKALLVVNTASFCGYTPQFRALQAAWERYRDRGLIVLGVPSDDFFQEAGSAAEVKAFCETNYDITFPMTDILHVTGRKADPFFAWAAEAGGRAFVPRWNFHKLLFGPDGQPAAAFPTGTEPDDPRVAAAIERLLPRGGS
jgi:glutathione peroxidase